MRRHRLRSVLLGALLAVATFGAISSVPARAAAATPAGRAVSITADLTGWDDIANESLSELTCLRDSGFSFDVVDLNKDADSATPASTTAWGVEYRNAAALGLDVVLFQGYYQPYWTDAGNGGRRGAAAATDARQIGYPNGAQIFLNVENNTNAAESTAIAWVQNWAGAVRAAGYTPGIYVGVPQALDAADLQSKLPDVTAFWRSLSSSAPQTTRGYVMRQTTIDHTTCGVTIDADVAGVDASRHQLLGAGFGATATHPAAAGAFVPVTPYRVADTRNGTSVGPFGTLTFSVAAAGVPATATAAVINLTVTGPAAAGWLVLHPFGSAAGNFSDLNFVAADTRANAAIAKIDSQGRASIRNSSHGAVQMIVDVSGYFLGGDATDQGAFVPVDPVRLLDTRGSPIGPQQDATVKTEAGSTGLAGSVVTNVTVTDAQAAGYLSVYPAGVQGPAASNLNFSAGQTIANLTTARVGTADNLLIRNGSGGKVDVIDDLQGYYRSGDAEISGMFTALRTPTRILDTRSGLGAPARPVGAGSALVIPIDGHGGVASSGVSAVVLNLTAVTPAGPGYAQIFPSGTSLPNASNLNFFRGVTVANLVTVPVGSDGRIVLYNSSSTSHYLIDVAGYYLS